MSSSKGKHLKRSYDSYKILAIFFQTHIKTFTSWIRYAILTVLLDGFFITQLYQSHKPLGIDIIALGIDAFIKLSISCILHQLQLREKSKPIPIAQFENSVLEKKPLLSYNHQDI